MRKLFIIILVIFLPLYLLLKTVEINTFNKRFYLNSYKKYNIIEITDKNINELDQVTSNLFEYLQDKSEEEALRPYFNQKEIKHMEDVKVLFKYGIILKNISFILSLLSIIFLSIYVSREKVGKGLFFGTFIWWGLILILFILSTMDFNKYFTYFHLIFFDNDLWLLDPNTDLLIQMLPEKFFISIFKRIVLFFMSILAIIQITSFILMKRGKNRDGRIIRI